MGRRPGGALTQPNPTHTASLRTHFARPPCRVAARAVPGGRCPSAFPARIPCSTCLVCLGGGWPSPRVSLPGIPSRAPRVVGLCGRGNPLSGVLGSVGGWVLWLRMRQPVLVLPGVLGQAAVQRLGGVAASWCCALPLPALKPSPTASLPPWRVPPPYCFGWCPCNSGCCPGAAKGHLSLHVYCSRSPRCLGGRPARVRGGNRPALAAAGPRGWLGGSRGLAGPRGIASVHWRGWACWPQCHPVTSLARFPPMRRAGDVACARPSVGLWVVHLARVQQACEHSRCGMRRSDCGVQVSWGMAHGLRWP